jgi:hypothetical protein
MRATAATHVTRSFAGLLSVVLAACTVPSAPDASSDATSSADGRTSSDASIDTGPGRSAMCGRRRFDGGAPDVVALDSGAPDAWAQDGAASDGRAPDASPSDGAVDAQSAPDVEAPLPGGECDLIDQNCAEGEGCYPDPSGAAGRCEPRGVASLGQPCEARSDCRPGLLCDLPPMGPGVCRSLCCPGAAGGCLGSSACVGLVDRDYGLCIAGANCSPFATMGADGGAIACPSGQACYVVSADGRVACLAEGRRARNESCDRVDACAPGLSCLRVNAMAPRCVSMCNAVDGRGCSAGEVCRALASGSSAVCEPAQQ